MHARTRRALFAAFAEPALRQATPGGEREDGPEKKEAAPVAAPAAAPAPAPAPAAPVLRSATIAPASQSAGGVEVAPSGLRNLAEAKMRVDQVRAVQGFDCWSTSVTLGARPVVAGACAHQQRERTYGKGSSRGGANCRSPLRQ